NAFFSLCAREIYQAGRISQRWLLALAHAMVICDLLAVAALVHFIGGAENHFIVLFIFPMIVASEFFSKRTAYAYAMAAAGLIHAIGWGEYILYERGHYPLRVLVVENPERFEPLVAPGAGQNWVFVFQVCFVMTFAVFATVFIASSIATRLRQREEELEDAYRWLQSLEQVKSSFMRKTSHELRAPVGTLQSLLKAAERQLPDGSPGRDLVARAAGRTENMLDLIDDLLRYSRLRAAARTVGRGRVELAEIVRGAAEMFRPRAEEKDLHMEVQAASADLVGVRDSLTDLVNNLVSNAIRYTPEGGRVTVRVGTEGGRPRLTVADTGIGIPDDELPHIFDEFFRGREAKAVFAHGTGLGMTIIKRVVEMHGGDIDVTSAPGAGTEFVVTFPPPAKSGRPPAGARKGRW
ncbi:MAG: HAMP domain-containing sensor histidine kinase, partial [Planctomycetota bacterium]|nr:HAMP domain-containing sensor histidine kinase [Planctomycetota bacterium]